MCGLTLRGICKIPTSSQSEKLETANANGVIVPFLRAHLPDSEPSWKQGLLGSFSLTGLQDYLLGKKSYGRSTAVFGGLPSWVFGPSSLWPATVFPASLPSDIRPNKRAKGGAYKTGSPR